MKIAAPLLLALASVFLVPSSPAQEKKAPSFLQAGKSYMFFTNSGEPAVSGVVKSLDDYPWVAVEAGTKRGVWTQYVNLQLVSGIRPYTPSE